MASAKNPGPLLTSVFKGAIEVISAEWRAKLGFTKTVQQQPTDVAPDAVATTLVESSVQQTRTDERAKEVFVIGDPTGQQLSGKVFTEHGTLATVTNTLVTSASPSVSYLTESIDGRDLGNGYIDLKIVTSPSFAVRPGQYYDENRNLIIGYTEQLVAANDGIGSSGTEVTPITDVLYRKRTITAPSQAALDAIKITFTSYSDIDLPTELRGLGITYNEGNGTGFSAIPTANTTIVVVGSSGTVDLSPNASAKGSASLVPQLDIDLVQNRWYNCPITNCLFYLPSPVTESAILAKLTTLLGSTVLAWPKFRPKEEYLTLQGQSTSVSAEATTRARLTFSPSNASGERVYGGGQSQEVSLTTQFVTIPACIHKQIVISNPAKQATATATADASTTTIATGTGTVLGVENIYTASKQIEAKVSPLILPATKGVTEIPSSGKYLYRCASEPWKYGYVAISAQVIDFANYA